MKQAVAFPFMVAVAALPLYVLMAELGMGTFGLGIALLIELLVFLVVLDNCQPK